MSKIISFFVPLPPPPFPVNTANHSSMHLTPRWFIRKRKVKAIDSAFHRATGAGVIAQICQSIMGPSPWPLLRRSLFRAFFARRPRGSAAQYRGVVISRWFTACKSITALFASPGRDEREALPAFYEEVATWARRRGLSLLLFLSSPSGEDFPAKWRKYSLGWWGIENIARVLIDCVWCRDLGSVCNWVRVTWKWIFWGGSGKGGVCNDYAVIRWKWT